MKSPGCVVRENALFFIAAAIFFCAGCAYLLSTGNQHGFLFLNSFHSTLFDSLFVNYTTLGDGLFSMIVIVIFVAMRRYQVALQILLAFVVSGLLVQLCKNFVPSPRPLEYFGVHAGLHIIKGVTHVGHSSFPSGHTASAFALATILSFFSQNKKLSVAYFALAALVGYSRIYLAQHFPLDVLAGAGVGILTALLVHCTVNFTFAGKANTAVLPEGETVIAEPGELTVAS